MALTGKRLLFVQEFIKLVAQERTFNATEAARRAGYSENGIRVTAHNLRHDPDIDKEIQAVIADQVMTADEVLVRLADEARGTIEDFIDIGANETYIKQLEGEIENLQKIADKEANTIRERLDTLKMIQEARNTIDRLREQPYRINLKKAEERGKLHLIKGLKPNQYGIGLELHDAQAAKVHIGKVHKLFVDKHEVTGANGEPLFKAYMDVDTDAV